MTTEKPLSPTIARLLELVDADSRSRNAIAISAGMSRSQLSQVLTGHRVDPSISSVERILVALGKSWKHLDTPKAKAKKG